MKSSAIAFWVCLILIFVSVIGLVSFPIASLTPHFPSSCDAQKEVWGPDYGYGSGNWSNSQVPVLLMSPGQTDYFCVEYLVSPYSASTAQALQERMSIAKGNCAEEQGGLGCGFYPSGSFTRSAGKILEVTPASDNSSVEDVQVIYSVNAMLNSTGFYLQSAPLGPCDDMPLAVGYPASQVNASDFFGWANPSLFSCVNVPFRVIEVGVIGFQVAIVDIPD